MHSKEIGSDFKINFYNNNSNNNIFYFFNCRTGIKKILNNFKNNNIQVLLPNYLCESIYDCFKTVNHLIYYNIKNDFSIDLENLKKKINNELYKVPISLIFIINYFGYIDDNIEIIIKICKSKNIILIEDFTHNLYSTSLYGDISICSYRKTISSPFGAILIDKNNILKLNQSISLNLKYILINIIKIFAMTLKNIYFLKFIWWNMLILCENYIDKINYDGYDYINHFFFKLYYNPQNIIYRKKNINYLNNKFNNLFKNELFIPNIFKKFSNCYFTFPLLFNNKIERDTIRNILIKNKIYCPIYWPLSFDKNNKCNNYIAEHILCIPIDQRYNLNDMSNILKIINKKYKLN